MRISGAPARDKATRHRLDRPKHKIPRVLEPSTRNWEFLTEKLINKSSVCRWDSMCFGRLRNTGRVIIIIIKLYFPHGLKMLINSEKIELEYERVGEIL